MGTQGKIDLIIVDDEQFMGKFFKNLLSNHKITYEFYTDPAVALERIVETRPRCVILDYNMPELTGQQLIIKLSEKHLFKTSSFYLFTSENFNDLDRMKLMTLGFEKIISKSTNGKDEILAAIEEVLGKLEKHVA